MTELHKRLEAMEANMSALIEALEMVQEELSNMVIEMGASLDED